MEREQRKTIAVTVTQDHLDKGIPKSHSHCPIALALADKGWPCPVVDTDGCYGGLHVQAWPRFKHSLRLQRYIKDFDLGTELAPSTFIIRREDT